MKQPQVVISSGGDEIRREWFSRPGPGYFWFGQRVVVKEDAGWSRWQRRPSKLRHSPVAVAADTSFN
ncbi:hypothetical protein Hdeb2414_s0014g00423931 [Helianthus debilis subsp. tardiflorus]